MSGWGGERAMRTRRAIYLRDKGICGICQRTCPYHQGHVDHIIPRSAGGPVWNPLNLRWTHATCNLEKGARDIRTIDPPGRASREW